MSGSFSSFFIPHSTFDISGFEGTTKTEMRNEE